MWALAKKKLDMKNENTTTNMTSATDIIAHKNENNAVRSYEMANFI